MNNITVKETEWGIFFFVIVKSFTTYLMVSFNGVCGRDGWKTSANLCNNRICLVGNSLQWEEWNVTEHVEFQNKNQ